MAASCMLFFHKRYCIMLLVSALRAAWHQQTYIKSLIGSSYHVTARHFSKSHPKQGDPLTQEYDAVIIGAGHNGLTAVSWNSVVSRLENGNCTWSKRFAHRVLMCCGIPTCCTWFSLSVYRVSNVDEIR